MITAAGVAGRDSRYLLKWPYMNQATTISTIIQVRTISTIIKVFDEDDEDELSDGQGDASVPQAEFGPSGPSVSALLEHRSPLAFIQ